MSMRCEQMYLILPGLLPVETQIRCTVDEGLHPASVSLANIDFALNIIQKVEV